MESSDADLAAALPVAKLVAQAVSEVINPDGINLHQANGAGSVQSVFHFHLHVAPRRFGDGLIMNWQLKPGNKEEIAAVAVKIKDAIDRGLRYTRLAHKPHRRPEYRVQRPAERWP